MTPLTRPSRPPGIDELTARESGVLCLLAAGLSNGEIGQEVLISETTVNDALAAAAVRTGFSRADDFFA